MEYRTTRQSNGSIRTTSILKGPDPDKRLRSNQIVESSDTRFPLLRAYSRDLTELHGGAYFLYYKDDEGDWCQIAGSFASLKEAEKHIPSLHLMFAEVAVFQKLKKFSTLAREDDVDDEDTGEL